MTRLARRVGARVVRGRDTLTLVHPDGTASRLDGASATLGEAVLELFDAGPRTRDEVIAEIEAQAEGPFDNAVIDDLLVLLERAGVVGAAREAPAGARPPRAGLRVVLGVTGAAQAMDAPRLVRQLQQRGFTVRVCATRAAARFVSLPMLAALTHHRPAIDHWGAADRPAAHVALAAWADVMLVYPASGTTISRVARGDFADVVAATALTTRAPVVLAPSMNPGMLAAPAVARNLAVLREDGFYVVDPTLGLEVADPPGARRTRSGAALEPEHLVDVVAIMAAQRAPTPSFESWERVYESGALPSWHVDVVPPDLVAALASLPPPRALLDVGCGLGVVAAHAAARGYGVVATDLAASALARARARADDLPITFLRDDVTKTAIASAFDVVVDRGCFHVLSPPGQEAYAAAISRLVRVGGALLLVSDGDTAAPDRGTTRLSPAALALRLPLFDLDRAAPTTLAADAPGAAWLTVWRRRAS